MINLELNKKNQSDISLAIQNNIQLGVPFSLTLSDDIFYPALMSGNQIIAINGTVSTMNALTIATLDDQLIVARVEFSPDSCKIDNAFTGEVLEISDQEAEDRKFLVLAYIISFNFL